MKCLHTKQEKLKVHAAVSSLMMKSCIRQVVCACTASFVQAAKAHDQCYTQDRPDPEGSAAEIPSSSGHRASGSGNHPSSSNDYASGNQTAASSSSNRARLPAGHAAAMREFREHADNTNDIFLVAAQAIAHSLITAHAALASGKCTGCLLPLVLSLLSLLILDDACA